MEKMDDLHIFPFKLRVSTHKREMEKKQRERFRKNMHNASLKEQLMRNKIPRGNSRKITLIIFGCFLFSVERRLNRKVWKESGR